MGWLFDIVVAIIGSGIVVTAGIITAGTLWLRRRNQVVAGVKSPAPLGWLNSGRREARLHRRLRASGRRLELVPPTEDVAELVSRLQIELVEVDEYLVTVSRRPKQVRREDRKAVEERVEEIESLVRRIEERNHTELLSLDELGERLDLLEAADDELGPPE